MQNLNAFNFHKSRKYRPIAAYIWRRRNTATCADIVRDLHLSNATVFPAVDYLQKIGMVESVNAAASNKGRKPKILRICGAQCFAIGIALQPQQAEISIVNAAHQLVGSRKLPGMSTDEKTALAQVLSAARALIAQSKLSLDRLAGLGVTLPGMIDCQQGLACRSTCFNAASDVSIVEYFENAFHRPCLVLGNSAALALTEKNWGKAADISTFLYFSGLGLGMFLNGQLFFGCQGFGGEIGFMKFGEGDEVTADGRTGTFDMITPFRQIGMRLQNAIQRGAHTLAAEQIRAGRPASNELVIEAALQGDALCRSLLADGFQVAAEMLIGLNYLFNPEAIFLLPFTEHCADISLDIVRRRLELCKTVNPKAHFKVLAAQHGREDLSRGIATLPLDRIFTP